MNALVISTHTVIHKTQGKHIIMGFTADRIMLITFIPISSFLIPGFTIFPPPNCGA